MIDVDNLGVYNLVAAAESFGLHLELLTHLSVFQWHQKLTPEHNPQLEATQLSPAPAL